MSEQGSRPASTKKSPEPHGDHTEVDDRLQVQSGVDDPAHEPIPAARITLDADEARQLHTASDGSSAGTFDDQFSPKLYDDSQKRIGRYVLLEELGRGGMGVVHAAYDERLGRKVAIKIVREQESEVGTRGQARLLREAQAMAQLTHPNIVTIFDVGKSDEGIFLAMEYIPGGTLQDFLEAEHPAWKVIKTFIEAGRGLIAAHEQGIVHRDFKPANVLLGRDGRIKVADFGLAALDGTGDSSAASESARDVLGPEMTQPGARIGTPAYMAPEQHQGKASTGLSDQFSFCVSLWEGLFGSHPFPAATVYARAERVTAGKIEAPKNPGRSPEAVRRILEKGMSSVPDDRHRSMKELVHLLETALTRGVQEERASSTTTVALGSDSKSILNGRYRLLDPHPASALLHVALDRLTGTFLAIQWAGSQGGGTGPSAHSEIQLSDQFRAMDGIEHPHLIGVKDFGYDDNYGAFLVHDLPRDASLLLSAARRASFDVQINYLMDVIRAVGFLHNRKVFGFAISTSDVVVHGGRAQLLLQFLPRGQRNDKGSSALQDMARLSQLALELIGDEKSGSGQRRAKWDSGATSPELAEAFAGVGREGDETTPEELAERISAAVGKRLAFETPETREATLRAISLVGRGSALRSFKARLISAIESRGSFCLVTGESGIGKSRFTEECRTITLDSGNRLYGGQAESETAIPYQIWQGPLRGLIAETPLSDFEASVLAWIVPDISQLTGKNVARAAELDGQAMRARLTEAVEGLIHRQSRATIIALEDLQWADSDSITLLQQLRTGLGRSQILLVGTCRTEDTADLLDTLSADEEIHLRVLGEESVQKLTRRIVGTQSDARKIADYVFRHSEGNPLFVAEVFRALADDAGSLAKITATALPDSPRTGGLRRAIQERLRRLPDNALPLLKIAAIAGRQFDPTILAKARPEEDVPRWLELVKTPAVIEQHGDSWRFSHDKLREAVLDDLNDHEKKRLHLEIGETIERVYGDDQAPRLAHHFLSANDKRVAHYSGIAGAQLVHSSPEEAVRFLAQATTFATENHRADVPHWGRLLAEALFDQGRVPEAAVELEKVCEASESPLPSTRLGWQLLLLWAVLVQLFHLWFSQRKPTGAEKSSRAEQVMAYDKLAEIYFFQAENLKAMTLCLLAINEGDRTGAVALNSLGIIAQTAAVMRLRKISSGYFAQGREALADDDSLFHPVFFMMETFTHAGAARWEDARSSALQGFELGKSLGHNLGASQCLSGLGLSEFNEGRFEQMLGRYETIFRLKNYNPAHDAGPSGGASTAHAMLGNRASALELGQRALDGASAQIPIMATAIHAGQALVFARFGDHRQACHQADLAMQNFDARQLPSVLTPSLIGPMEAYLLAWRDARENEPRLVDTYSKKAIDHLKHMRAFCQLYPHALGFLSLSEGRVALLLNKQRDAMQHFTSGLVRARASGLRHCEGLILEELARLSRRGSNERQAYLFDAAELFQDLRALPDLKNVRSLQRDDRAARS